MFGFEGGLAGRPWLLLFDSSEMSAFVALLAHKGSILRQTITTTASGALWSWWTERRVLGISATSESILSLEGPELGFAAC